MPLIQLNESHITLGHNAFQCLNDIESSILDSVDSSEYLHPRCVKRGYFASCHNHSLHECFKEFKHTIINFTILRRFDCIFNNTTVVIWYYDDNNLVREERDELTKLNLLFIDAGYDYSKLDFSYDDDNMREIRTFYFNKSLGYIDNSYVNNFLHIL